MRRLWLAPVWALLVVLPLAFLAAELITRPGAWLIWTEHRRIAGLLLNTLILGIGTAAVAVPAGSVLGFVVWRTDLAAAGLLRAALLPALFLPLPVLATAWQAALSWAGLGPDAIFLDRGPDSIWTPWNRGLTAAIAIHAAHALPWAIWIAGHGFAAADRSAEEDALTHGGAWAAFRRVALPAARPAIALAALWVAMQTTAEIAVTDMMQVRTFAEEVYAQFSRPDPDAAGGTDLALARSLAAVLPPTLAMIAATLYLLHRGRHAAGFADAPTPRRPIYQLGIWRLPVSGAAGAAVAALLLVPLVSLIAKTGAVPPDDAWSLSAARHHLAGAFDVQWRRTVMSLATSLATGAGCAALAAATCRAMLASARVRAVMTILAAVLWALPGPVLGFALKIMIDRWIALSELFVGVGPSWVRTALYDGPSPWPVMWATGLRFVPLALVLLWPAVSSLPSGLRDAARTDGASAWMEFRHAVLPFLRGPLVRAALVVAALSLGELSAGRLVQTPGGQTFAQEIFQQMHYGVNNHLAAMCLILIAMVLPLSWLTRMK